MKSWTLSNVANDQYLSELILGEADLGEGFPSCQVRKQTLRGGLRDGVDAVEVFNGAMQFAVLPTRGMGLWRVRQQTEPRTLFAESEPQGVQLGWRSPVRGPVHPQHVPLMAPDGIGWLCGFDELLVRCGLESHGPPEFNQQGQLSLPLHGRIANLPAHQVEVSVQDEEIIVSGQVEESRLFFNKLRLTSTVRTRAGSLRLDVVDQVQNFSAQPATMELLYHVNFGLPLLDPGSKVVLPVETLVPRDPRAAEGISTWDTYEPPQPGFAEQAYFFRLAADADGRTQAVLRNAAGSQGVRLHLNVHQLPCFTLWKSTQSPEDGYVTGLEPGTSFPNANSFEREQGRLTELAPGESTTLELGIEILPDQAAVSAAVSGVEALGATVEPTIHRTPQPGWTA